MPRIYYPQPLNVGNCITLSADAAHHVHHVLRLPPNTEIILFNGDGNDYQGTIQSIHKKQVIVKLNQKSLGVPEPLLKIHLFQALTRTEKMDWIIQKAVELGATAITPIITRHCAIRYRTTQLLQKHLHWQKIIYSAAEQCGRATLPNVHTARTFMECLSQPKDLTLLFAPQAHQNFASLASLTPTHINLFIGPEGGWHIDELEYAQANQFHFIQLGKRILRMETAAIASMSIVQSQWGDMR